MSHGNKACGYTLPCTYLAQVGRVVSHAAVSAYINFDINNYVTAISSKTIQQEELFPQGQAGVTISPQEPVFLERTRRPLAQAPQEHPSPNATSLTRLAFTQQHPRPCHNLTFLLCISRGQAVYDGPGYNRDTEKYHS